jgi:hypothetical protein
MDLGIAAWMTHRTLERSIPMPKATVATITLIAGAALIGGGGAMWFLTPSPGRPEPAVTPEVSVGRGGVHVSLGGTF